MDLKEASRLALTHANFEKDYKRFKTIDFDPKELIQLKEMNGRQLQGLMIYCGIRVYDGVPLCVMEEDEMRMAYLVWRAELINEKKKFVRNLGKRGMKWMEQLQEAMKAYDYM